ncbi:hypothetical protein [uncultured Dubosiella sp.]|uniref:hypothetical protein n=1 Tax=uncultured Dubosiella sp. TaxID=1937011 RepID=UPI002731FCD0|nr:hypothetical protein [uncultured Dubosiella sp.]
MEKRTLTIEFFKENGTYKTRTESAGVYPEDVANAVINLAIWLKTMNNGEQILNDALKIIEEETGKSKVQA